MGDARVNNRSQEGPHKATAPADRRTIAQRLAAARAALGSAPVLSAEESQRVLRIRAEALARAPEPPTGGPASGSIEVVELALADERYALESRYVREVCRLGELTPLPCTPSFVRGIFNLRGEMLSVVDLEILFELPAKKLTDRDKVVVLVFEEMCFGILVDGIVGVRDVATASLEPGLPTLTGICADYLRGVTPERLIVLDGLRLLTDDGIVVHQLVGG